MVHARWWCTTSVVSPDTASSGQTTLHGSMSRLLEQKRELDGCPESCWCTTHHPARRLISRCIFPGRYSQKTGGLQKVARGFRAYCMPSRVDHSIAPCLSSFALVGESKRHGCFPIRAPKGRNTWVDGEAVGGGELLVHASIARRKKEREGERERQPDTAWRMLVVWNAPVAPDRACLACVYAAILVCFLPLSLARRSRMVSLIVHQVPYLGLTSLTSPRKECRTRGRNKWPRQLCAQDTAARTCDAIVQVKEKKGGGRGVMLQAKVTRSLDKAEHDDDKQRRQGSKKGGIVSKRSSARGRSDKVWSGQRGQDALARLLASLLDGEPL